MKKRTKFRAVIALALLAALGFGVRVSIAKLRGVTHDLPTTRVQRGTVDLKVYTYGDLRALHSSMLIAPAVGGTLQIVHLAKTGTLVKKDDVVLEFDPSEQEYNLEQAQSALKQADEQLVKAKDDGAVQSAADQVALLHARYDVRRAELDCSLNELASAIDAKKNDLALEEAHRKLDQLEQDVKSRVASNQAQLALYQEQRNKALLDISQAEDHIKSMTVRAPMDGLVTIRENRDSLGGGFWLSGISFAEYQEGDATTPGRQIGDIVDISQMEISSGVPETARADINAGDPAKVTLDALPGITLDAKVKTIAGLANGGWGGDDPTRRFDTTFAIDQSDARLRPGLTAQIVVLGKPLQGVLYLPRQSVFMRAGTPVVYVREGHGFEPHVISIKHMTETQAVIEGLSEGTEVALVNPEAGAGPVTTPAIGQTVASH
jgi:HlyD family secretion protein